MQLLKLMKQAGIQAVDTTSPMKISIGTVISIAPLVIEVEQRLPIPSEFLLLTDNVIDKEIDITISGLNSKRTCTIHNGLKTGEKVLLLRVQGGQQFIVLNRVVSA